MSSSKQPAGYHTVTPALVVRDANAAIDFYRRAFGASEVSRMAGPDGKIMHAELRIGNSKFMVNDAMMGSKGPRTLGGSPASLWLYVDDCDTLYNRALQAGAKPVDGLAQLR